MRDKIKKIFLEVLEIPAEEFSDELSPSGEGAWNSLTHLQMIQALEKAFNVQFISSEIELLTSIKDIEEAIRKKASSDN